jgi:hypothetical protein
MKTSDHPFLAGRISVIFATAVMLSLLFLPGTHSFKDSKLSVPSPRFGASSSNISEPFSRLWALIWPSNEDSARAMAHSGITLSLHPLCHSVSITAVSAGGIGEGSGDDDLGNWDPD